MYDPYEEYITLNAKKAQLSWTYLEHFKKIEEIQNIIQKTRISISNFPAKDPEFAKKYSKKYMDARKVSGFEDSKNESNCVKFMVEDEPLPGIDNTYTLTPNYHDEFNDEPKEEGGGGCG